MLYKPFDVLVLVSSKSFGVGWNTGKELVKSFLMFRVLLTVVVHFQGEQVEVDRSTVECLCCWRFRVWDARDFKRHGSKINHKIAWPKWTYVQMHFATRPRWDLNRFIIMTFLPLMGRSSIISLQTKIWPINFSCSLVDWVSSCICTFFRDMGDHCSSQLLSIVVLINAGHLNAYPIPCSVPIYTRLLGYWLLSSVTPTFNDICECHIFRTYFPHYVS